MKRSWAPPPRPESTKKWRQRKKARKRVAEAREAQRQKEMAENLKYQSKKRDSKEPERYGS